MRFSTVSDLEIEPLYTPEDVKRRLRRARSAIRASIRTRAACTARCTAGGCGRCASSRASASPRTPTARFHFLLAQGQDGLSTAFDMPGLMGYDADHERAQRRGRTRGRLGHPRSTTWRACSTASRSTKSPTSMTINCSASVLLAMYLVVAERQGVPWEQGRRHDPERHAQGVHRAEGMDLVRRAPSLQNRHRHDRVLREEGAAMACGVDFRLPHPRGRLDRGAGTRVHHRRRNLLRRGRSQARPQRRRFRAAPVVLLEPAQRLP